MRSSSPQQNQARLNEDEASADEPDASVDDNVKGISTVDLFMRELFSIRL
jgi:hypothetical protein